MVFYRKFCKFFCLLLALCLLLPHAAVRGAGERVRVLLSVGSRKELTLSLQGDWLCQERTLTGGTLICSVAQKGVRLSHSEAGRLDAAAEILLQPLGADSRFVLKHRDYQEQTYAGELILSRTPKGYVRVVNRVSMEEYQYGVLLGELSAGDPLEGAKALAVAARGLALNGLGSEAAYDITDAGDNPDYYGTGGEPIAAFREAVSCVAGQTLTYHNAPVETHYCRGNGGRTRLPEQVWKGEADPAFANSYDPADLAGDAAACTLLVTGDPAELPEGVCAFLLEKARLQVPAAVGIEAIHRFAGEDTVPGKTCPVQVQLLLRTEGGSEGLTLSFDLSELAALLGAAAYDICYVQQEARGALAVFSTMDGHGVGLSRRGLCTMGAEGYDYRTILSFYYPGARLDGVPEAAEEVAQLTPAPERTALPDAKAEATPLPGDVDADGQLTRADTALLTRYLLGLTTFSHDQHTAADVNGDGQINLTDRKALQQEASAVDSRAPQG